MCRPCFTAKPVNSRYIDHLEVNYIKHDFFSGIDTLMGFFMYTPHAGFWEYVLTFPNLCLVAGTGVIMFLEGWKCLHWEELFRAQTWVSFSIFNTVRMHAVLAGPCDDVKHDPDIQIIGVISPTWPKNLSPRDGNMVFHFHLKCLFVWIYVNI